MDRDESKTTAIDKATPQEASAPALRQLPVAVLDNAEKMIALLERGVPYHKAQIESGLLAGQATAIYDNVPALRERIEIACTAFKKQARHIVLQKAVDQVINGSKKEILNKDGDIIELHDDVPVQAQVALLAGLDKDFSKTGAQDTGSAPALTMNFNLPQDVMVAIRTGNADVVEQMAELARQRQKGRREANVIDVTPEPEKKA